MLRDVAWSMLAPGCRVRRNRVVMGVVLVAVGTALPVVVAGALLLSGRDRLAMSLDARVLLWVMVIGVLAVAARVAALVELVSSTPRRSRRHDAPIALAIGVCAVMTFGIVQVGRARASIGEVFRPSDRPLYEATAPVTTTTTTTTTTSIVLPVVSVPTVPTTSPSEEWGPS